MSEPTLQDCINYMRSQIKQMERHPRNYEFNLPYYRKTVELLEKAQRPHGKWIDESKDALRCSACGKLVYKPFIGGFPTERTQHYNPNYCAFCGADMRTQNDRSWDTSERGVSGSVKNSIAQEEGEVE